MMEKTLSREQERLLLVANELRTQGYQVIMQPTPDQLPDFLRQYNPDMIAQKGQEKIVVEVKSRRSLSQTPGIRDMARLLQDREDWKFELIMVGGDTEPIITLTAQSLNETGISNELDRAKQLLDTGFSDAALLLAWSAAEAALRLLAEREGLNLQNGSSLQLIKSLVTEGVISRADYELLVDVMRIRNTVAHGYKTEELDQKIVRRLVDAVPQLIHP